MQTTAKTISTKAWLGNLYNTLKGVERRLLDFHPTPLVTNKYMSEWVLRQLSQSLMLELEEAAEQLPQTFKPLMRRCLYARAAAYRLVENEAAAKGELDIAKQYA